MGAPALKFGQHQILVTEKMAGSDVISHALSQGAYHLVQKDGIEYEKEKTLAEMMINSPKSFFVNPLRAIICENLEKENLFNYQCAATANKRTLIQYLEDFLHQHPRTKNAHNEVLLAADEIFTNASKNSGVFYSGGAAKVANQGQVEFSAYIDSTRVVIVCSDSFGRLQIPHLLGKIKYCYEKGVAGAIQHGDSGAGIGSFLIFNNCSSYYLAVENGRRTIVGVGFQYTPRSTDKECLSKHLNMVAVE